MMRRTEEARGNLNGIGPVGEGEHTDVKDSIDTYYKQKGEFY